MKLDTSKFKGGTWIHQYWVIKNIKTKMHYNIVRGIFQTAVTDECLFRSFADADRLFLSGRFDKDCILSSKFI